VQLFSVYDEAGSVRIDVVNDRLFNMRSHYSIFHLVPAWLLLFVASATAKPAGDIICGAKACFISNTLIQLRVIPQPFSPLYRHSNDQSEVLVPAVPAYEPLYVFAREGIDAAEGGSKRGWYKVGFDRSDALGWMKARDLVEWRNSLVLARTPIGEGNEKRNPVIGFAALNDLRAIALGDNRKVQAADLIESLNDRSPIPVAANSVGVVYAEQRGPYRSIDEAFYWWPILSWSQPDIEEQENFLNMPKCCQTARRTSTRMLPVVIFAPGPVTATLLTVTFAHSISM